MKTKIINKLSEMKFTSDSPMLFPIINKHTIHHAHGSGVFNAGAQEV